MEFFEIPFYDDDFIKMLFRFVINFFFTIILVRYIYYPIAKRKDYLLTYMLISTVVFFICFTLKKFDMGLGMALGLFAIFGILRYRTDTIPIKEMTYLFVIIGLSVINSLSNKKMSVAELLFTNFMLLGISYFLEKKYLLKHETQKVILYDKIENVKPQNYLALKEDLEQRTGLLINRIEVGKLDMLQDVATVRVFYFDSEQLKNYEGDNYNS
jgi:hypothetical protein